MNRIINVFIITFTILLIATNNIYAKQINFSENSVKIIKTSSTGIGSATEIIDSGKQFINKGQGDTPISMQEAKNLLPIGRIIEGIAILVLLSVGAILGVKYMISGADERANVKQKLIWYVVAAVLVFGAISIYDIVVRIFNSSGLV